MVSDVVISLVIIGKKNVQSLQLEFREEESMAKLRTIKYNEVLLNEMRREKKQERQRTEDGLICCGADGKKDEQTLTILFYHQWINRFYIFHSINKRICAINNNMNGNLLRYIAIYIFHNNQNDTMLKRCIQKQMILYEKSDMPIYYASYFVIGMQVGISTTCEMMKHNGSI